jgi:putative glutamine amidotransferase
MLKVYIEQTNEQYNKLFLSMGFELVESYEEANLVCFTGGSDVTPSMYGEKTHPLTFNQESRDKYCIEVFNFCVENSIPMVGICRGSQFLCVANGGTLWQDIDGHTRPHNVVSINNEVFQVTSTHHQEMNPVGGEILLYANSGTYRSYMNGDGIPTTIPAVTPTVEAVYWHETMSLGVQGHPEFGDASPEFVSWFKTEVRDLFY